MAHNDEAGGSAYGGDANLRSLQITYDKADVMYWQRIPVPLQYKVPHGWHMSNGGYAVPPPPPPGPRVRALIDERRASMSPAEHALPENTRDSPAWLRRFQEENDAKLTRSSSRTDAGRYNRSGRRAWWAGHDFDATLRQYGFRPRVPNVDGQRWPLFFPQAQIMAPALQMLPPRVAAQAASAHSAHSRSGSSGSAGRQRSSPYPPPTGGIAIHDVTRRAASAPGRRTAPVKREVKEESGSSPRGRVHRRRQEHAAAPPPEKKWWEIEAEALAALPGEFPGEHLLYDRSINEGYRQITLSDHDASLWSAKDHGANYVDLAAGPSRPPAPAPVPKDEDASSSFSFSTDDDKCRN